MELYSDGSIWNADAPVNADFTGFEIGMSVETEEAEIILIESGEGDKVELQGDVEENTGSKRL